MIDVSKKRLIEQIEIEKSVKRIGLKTGIACSLYTNYGMSGKQLFKARKGRVFVSLNRIQSTYQCIKKLVSAGSPFAMELKIMN